MLCHFLYDSFFNIQHKTKIAAELNQNSFDINRLDIVVRVQRFVIADSAD